MLVKINGPRYTRKYDYVHFNCSADYQPLGNAAEILINSKTFTHMRSSNGKCFSATIGRICSGDICNCSVDGTWFYHKYKVIDEKHFKISCLMKFDRGRNVSDSIDINVIDLIGPDITSSSTLPFVIGTVEQLSCRVKTKIKSINIKWNCVNSYPALEKLIENIHLSTITFAVRLSYQNSNCTCTVSYKDFSATHFLLLEVKALPVLKLENQTICNTSLSVSFSCTITNDVSHSRFSKWIHSVNGVAIRLLDGLINNGTSTIAINSCSYQDIGVYTCVVLNDSYANNTLVSKNVSLKVIGPPVIVSSRVIRDIKVVLVVQFVSSSDVTQRWSFMSQPIEDLHDYNVTIGKKEIMLEMYEQRIIFDGYKSSLTMSKFVSGVYVVALQNDFGQTVEKFNVQTGHVIHIIGPNEHSPSIPIYHSAPESDNSRHIYDQTIPQYLEVIESGEQDDHSDSKEDESAGEIFLAVFDQTSHDYEEIQ
ncbi:unnamed protein product [Mytilus coruscus]|uniref:Ig-like domain-containing protein n=1 Tax=Mytilus coruscus TaxID=42192 RepID=A0A6J7ZYH3_MYTCO|nr:unnamed protein product [Mytilus coruscus]